MSEIWLLLDSGPGDPAWNMALDEALLQLARTIGHPLIRFYSWTQPAASFGYFQRIAEVERATHFRPLVRRPTAGGIVPHNADWTYAVILPAGHEWYQLKAEQSYRRMHEWIRRAFDVLDVQSELARGSRRPAPGQCFAGYEVHDLLWRGRKIAGAAQRRTRSGLLIQGSVQPPPLNLDRAAWQRAMTQVGPAVWQDWQPSEELIRLCEHLMQTKHRTESYQNKR